jgi:SEC-C motif
VIQSPDDLARHLEEQIGFLRASAQAFDDGVEAEAKRLATVIRVLVHDTARSRSLLGLLGLKETLWFLDTSRHRNTPGMAPNFVSESLTSLEISPGALRHVAPLDDLPPSRRGPPARVEAWWKTPVLTDADAMTFSRRDLVLALANRDGGAHVDPELGSAYARLSRNNSFGWVAHSGDPFQDGATFEAPTNSPAVACVRQCAFEVDLSLRIQLDFAPEGSAAAGGVATRSPFGDPYNWPIPHGLARRNDLCPCESGKKYKKCHGR